MLHLTHSEASEAILAACDAGTIIQGSWHKVRDGVEMACLLGSLDPSVTKPSDCNGHLMPLWLAESIPTLFDGLRSEAVLPISRRFGALINRWEVLTPLQWDSVLTRYLCRLIDQAVESARPQGEIPAYWPAVEAACASCKEALINKDCYAATNAAYAATSAARAATNAANAAYAATNAAYAATSAARAATNAANAAYAATSAASAATDAANAAYAATSAASAAYAAYAARAATNAANAANAAYAAYAATSAASAASAARAATNAANAAYASPHTAYAASAATYQSLFTALLDEIEQELPQ